MHFHKRTVYAGASHNRPNPNITHFFSTIADQNIGDYYNMRNQKGNTCDVPRLLILSKVNYADVKLK